MLLINIKLSVQISLYIYFRARLGRPIDKSDVRYMTVEISNNYDNF